MMHEGKAAAAEFQKFIDHRGLVANFSWGALARLGWARAYAVQGDTTKARPACQDFLTLWEDADSDVPILKQARSEYAKMQNQRFPWCAAQPPDASLVINKLVRETRRCKSSSRSGRGRCKKTPSFPAPQAIGSGTGVGIDEDCVMVGAIGKNYNSPQKRGCVYPVLRSRHFLWSVPAR